MKVKQNKKKNLYTELYNCSNRPMVRNFRSETPFSNNNLTNSTLFRRSASIMQEWRECIDHSWLS